MKTIEQIKEDVRQAVATGGDDRWRLSAAFTGLRKLGYVARARYMCCGSCATYSIATDLKKRLGLSSLEEIPDADQLFVTWNVQADGSFDGGRDLVLPLHLRWGGDGGAIVDVLNAAGLRTEGGLDADLTIQVLPKADAYHWITQNVEGGPCRICGKAEADHARRQYGRHGKRYA